MTETTGVNVNRVTTAKGEMMLENHTKTLSDTTTIADRLRFFRKEVLNKTQSEIAEHLNLSQPAFNRIETGKNNLTVKNLRALNTQHGISIDWLLTGEGEILSGSNKETAKAVENPRKRPGPEVQKTIITNPASFYSIQNTLHDLDVKMIEIFLSEIGELSVPAGYPDLFTQICIIQAIADLSVNTHNKISLIKSSFHLKESK